MPKPPSFSTNLQKMRETYILLLEGGLGDFGVSQAGWEDGLRSTLTDFVHHMKGSQPIGRKILYKPPAQRIRGLEGFLYEAVKNLELLSKIQDHN